MPDVALASGAALPICQVVTFSVAFPCDEVEDLVHVRGWPRRSHVDFGDARDGADVRCGVVIAVKTQKGCR